MRRFFGGASVCESCGIQCRTPDTAATFSVPVAGTARGLLGFPFVEEFEEEMTGRGILLWLLGVPIPVIILLWLFFGH
jgi:hypothetical protein